MLAPAKSIAQMKRIIFSDYIDAALAGLFIFVVVAIAVYGVIAVLRAPRSRSRRCARRRTKRCRPRRHRQRTLREAAMFSDLGSDLRSAGRYLGQALRLMVGLPDYDTYVAHARDPSGPRADDV